MDDTKSKRGTRAAMEIYDVYLMGDGLPQARQRWVKVGIAFENHDTSINVVLDALPLNGKVQLRPRGQLSASPHLHER